MTVTERAFQLARDGDFWTVDAIAEQLSKEGYDRANIELAGAGVRNDLTKAIVGRISTAQP